MELYIAGEDIPAGASVIQDGNDGKLYTCDMRSGILMGAASENIREGFRISAAGGILREDDA